MGLAGDGCEDVLGGGVDHLVTSTGCFSLQIYISIEISNEQTKYYMQL